MTHPEEEGVKVREYVVVVGSMDWGKVSGMFTKEEAEAYAIERRMAGLTAIVRGVTKP